MLWKGPPWICAACCAFELFPPHLSPLRLVSWAVLLTLHLSSSRRSLPIASYLSSDVLRNLCVCLLRLSPLVVASLLSQRLPWPVATNGCTPRLCERGISLPPSARTFFSPSAVASVWKGWNHEETTEKNMYTFTKEKKTKNIYKMCNQCVFYRRVVPSVYRSAPLRRFQRLLDANVISFLLYSKNKMRRPTRGIPVKSQCRLLFCPLNSCDCRIEM